MKLKEYPYISKRWTDKDEVRWVRIESNPRTTTIIQGEYVDKWFKFQAMNQFERIDYVKSFGIIVDDSGRVRIKR